MINIGSLQNIKQISTPLTSGISKVASNTVEMMSKDTFEMTVVKPKAKPNILKRVYNTVKNFIVSVYKKIKSLFSNNSKAEQPVQPPKQPIQTPKEPAKPQVDTAKQKEIEEAVEKTREKLTGKTKVSAESIDKEFNNYQSGNKELDEMKQYYEGLEAKEAAIKEDVKALGDKLSGKTKVSAEGIDKGLKNPELEDLNKQYRELEDKINWRKSHPEEAKKIDKARKAERKAAKRAAEEAEKQEQLAEHPNYFIKKSKVKVNPKEFDISKPCEGEVIEKFDRNGNLIRRNIDTVYDVGQDIRIHSDGIKTIETYKNNGVNTIKTSKLGSDGKYHELERETRTYKSDTVKRVKALENGNKEITVIDADKTVITVRDKKGKIVSEKIIRTDKGPSDPPPPSSNGNDAKPIEIIINRPQVSNISISELLRKKDELRFEYIELMKLFADGKINEAQMKQMLQEIIRKYAPSIDVISYINQLKTITV